MLIKSKFASIASILENFINLKHVLSMQIFQFCKIKILTNKLNNINSTSILEPQVLNKLTCQ